MDSTGSVSAVEAAIDRLSKQRSDLEELWAARKLRLDLSLRLRLFERDALEVRTYVASKIIIIKCTRIKEQKKIMCIINRD